MSPVTARSSKSPVLWLRMSAKPLRRPVAPAICTSASGTRAPTSWWRRNTRLLSLITRSCSLVARMRRSCSSVSALAPVSWAVLPMSACASRPLSSATSMKAATWRNTVMSIQFGGTWISSTRAETSSQPTCWSSQTAT